MIGKSMSLARYELILLELRSCGREKSFRFPRGSFNCCAILCSIREQPSLATYCSERFGDTTRTHLPGLSTFMWRVCARSLNWIPRNRNSSLRFRVWDISSYLEYSPYLKACRLKGLPPPLKC